MIKWRCTLCGECCKQYVPLVLPEDVQRIQSSLHRPMSSFITFYRETDFQGPLDESYQPQLFQTKHGKLVMGLNRVDLEGGEVGCIFVKDNVCSIHSFKPLVCRQYPFQPVDTANINGPFRLMENPCFGRHATDELVPEPPLRKNYILFHQKQDAYLEKIKEWNEDPASQHKDIDDFLQFVGLKWDES
ncbi:MAG: YkgJ family cysteine cluster protein [SAR202 cluster bacterium]|nr:YkgJ family cysteine cluster protein [SAR202 cluster bacterium]